MTTGPTGELRPSTESAPSSHTVIIPAYNEERSIARCLASVRACLPEHGNTEIVVVDNCSSDRTPELAEAGGARVIRPAERVSIAELRNQGAQVARGEVLAFLDADMLVPPHWLELVDRAFAEGARAVGFVEGVPEEAPWFARVWAEAVLARRDQPVEVDFLPGRNLCVDGRLYREIGGFDAALMTSEDKDLCLRLVAAGGSVVSRPERGFIHLGYERTFGEWVRKEFWRQSSHLRMLRKYGLRSRLLRLPLAGLAHLVWGGVIAAAAARGAWALAAVFLALWFAPGFAMAIRYPRSRRTPLALIQFAALHMLRFLIVGVAFIQESAAFLLGFQR